MLFAVLGACVGLAINLALLLKINNTKDFGKVLGSFAKGAIAAFGIALLGGDPVYAAIAAAIALFGLLLLA